MLKGAHGRGAADSAAPRRGGHEAQGDSRGHGPAAFNGTVKIQPRTQKVQKSL